MCGWAMMFTLKWICELNKNFFFPQVESHGKMQNMAEDVTTVLLEIKINLLQKQRGSSKNDNFFICIKNLM